MRNRLLPLLLLFIGGAIDTAGDLVMKTWVVSNRRTVFILGLVIYLIGLVWLAESYKYEKIAVASIIFVVFNVIILAVVSWLYFKEPLTTVQIIGILMGIGAVALLEFGGKPA